MLARIRAKIQGIALAGAVSLAGFQVINTFFALDTICDVLIITMLAVAQRMK